MTNDELIEAHLAEMERRRAAAEQTLLSKLPQPPNV